MNLLDLVNLAPLMELTNGRPEIVIALIDGPVLFENSLASGNVRELAEVCPVRVLSPVALLVCTAPSSLGFSLAREAPQHQEFAQAVPCLSGRSFQK